MSAKAEHPVHSIAGFQLIRRRLPRPLLKEGMGPGKNLI